MRRQNDSVATPVFISANMALAPTMVTPSIRSRADILMTARRAGYGTEAAFNRAFSRAYGMPPNAWRRAALLKG